MAFLELTQEEKPKLAVQVNNSLKYQDKDGNLQDRQKVTALIDIVKEASSVAGMDKGAVMLSLNTENGFKNYFVNRTNNDDIALVPMDKNLQQDKDNFIYFNKKLNVDDPTKFFYTMNKEGNSEAILDSIKVVKTDKSAYLGARVTLANKDIQEEMESAENITGKRMTAIIGKDKLEVVANSELQKRRENKSQEQTQSKEAPTKNIPVKTKDKDVDVADKKSKEKTEPKKSFKPKSKDKNQQTNLER